MDPLACLLMLADASSAADRREYHDAINGWRRMQGYKVPAADLRAKGVSNQRIAAWIRNGWVEA